MKKPFLITCALLGFLISSYSQTSELNVKLGARGLFIEHPVAARENFYSIGRAFNVHPKRLASFNGLDMAKGLSLGQVIHVPLSDTNLLRKAGEGVAVYYQSTANQTVGTISAISKTSSENLRLLNNLSNDHIPANTKIIIGYLVGEGPGGLAAGNETTDSKEIVPEKLQSQTESPAKNKNETTVAPALKTETSNVEPKNTVKNEAGSVQTVSQTVQDNKEGDGFFKAVFVQQVKTYPLSKEETVTSGIFKTISGWNDAKFYALIDGIEPGTIIKVTNPNNNKQVYAKVLGPMSGIRQNQGLNLRISNAAASSLEITETDKFIVRVNY